MQVWPIGITTTGVSVYWPLWEAALLRRFGRAPSWGCAAAGFHRWPGPLLGHLHARARPDGLYPIWRRPPLVLEDPPVADQPLPELDLLWPSDEPPETTGIIVVERVIPEPYPVPGSFIDVLY